MSAHDPIGTVCPKCGYQRRAEEHVPDWQCPSCHVAYNKVQPQDISRAHTGEKRPVLGGSSGYRALQRLMTVLLILAFAAAGWSWHQKRQIPALVDLHPLLMRDPEQVATSRAPFSFEYRGNGYEVQPVASYDLRGLVVTHNDINAFWDIYHDESSVDTRDICVVWGENLRGDDIRKAKFWSTAWTCWFEYPPGVRINADQLSNNHLITDDPELRERISHLRVGDQVHVRGMLVNYRPGGEQYWRKTSTVRTDHGAGACEVVFVEQLQVLGAGNAGSYSLYTASRWAITALIATKLFLLLVNVSTPIGAGRVFNPSQGAGEFDND